MKGMKEGMTYDKKSMPEKLIGVSEAKSYGCSKADAERGYKKVEKGKVNGY